MIVEIKVKNDLTDDELDNILCVLNSVKKEYGVKDIKIYLKSEKEYPAEDFKGIPFFDDLPVGTLSKNKVFYERAPYDSLRQKGDLIRKHFKENNND